MKRGDLKIFLGFAAGVGKTYQMLGEAHAAAAAGVDVAIGYFEPHARKDTIALAEGLETIPRKCIEYRGGRFAEMDVDAILSRKPALCLVDEFPHSNLPGERHDKRWKDVMELLDAGISVLTTMNIQHLESLNDQVFEISGVRVRETIPDWVLQQASEVVMVDLTPRALLHRLERGVVYSPEKAREAAANFFRLSTLAALREMALRQTAHEVGAREQHLQEANPAQAAAHAPQIVAVVADDPASAALLRRAKRVADFLSARCIAVAVVAPDDESTRAGVARRAAIERHLNFARNLHIETHIIQGRSVALAVAQFARAHAATQIFLSWPKRSGWRPPWRRNEIQTLVRHARDLQITIVDDHRPGVHP